MMKPEKRLIRSKHKARLGRLERAHKKLVKGKKYAKRQAKREVLK